MHTNSIVYISSFVKERKVIGFSLVSYFFVTCSRYNIQKVVFLVISQRRMRMGKLDFIDKFRGSSAHWFMCRKYETNNV